MRQIRPVIVDRDGVINQDSAQYVKTPDEFIPIAGSLAAIGRLTAAGFTVLVVTNQANIGRGVMTEKTLDAIHAKLMRELRAHGGRIERFYVCPHCPEDSCECRKPRPGLLQRAAADYRFPLTNVWYVGDSLKDLEAAAAAGAQGVLVRTGNGARIEADGAVPPGIRVFDDLAAAADALLATAAFNEPSCEESRALPLSKNHKRT